MISMTDFKLEYREFPTQVDLVKRHARLAIIAIRSPKLNAANCGDIKKPLTHPTHFKQSVDFTYSVWTPPQLARCLNRALVALLGFKALRGRCRMFFLASRLFHVGSM